MTITTILSCSQIMLNQVSSTWFPDAHCGEFARRFGHFEAQKENLELLRARAGGAAV